MSLPKEGSRDVHDGIIVSMVPDICLTPAGGEMVPVPYTIWCRQADAANLANSVRQTDDRSHAVASLVLRCYGDEPGTGGGIYSGTMGADCTPKTWSPTVRAESRNMVRHDDEWWMNHRNTYGKLVYTKDLGVYPAPDPAQIKPQMLAGNQGSQSSVSATQSSQLAQASTQAPSSPPRPAEPSAPPADVRVTGKDCCCVTNVSITSHRWVGDVPQELPGMDPIRNGDVFNVKIDMDFTKGQTSPTCVLEWKERTNRPAAGITGQQPNTWTDIYKSFPSATFTPWKYYQPPADGGSDSAFITDEPALGSLDPNDNFTRTLEFDIGVKSAAGCGCANSAKSAKAKQIIKVVNGQVVSHSFNPL